MLDLDKQFWLNRRVFVTGHTGFKGAWLCCWLKKLGAQVYGYSLEPDTSPCLYTIVNDVEKETIGDILDVKRLEEAVAQAKPDIVLHLAAQAIVRQSYEEPLGTFSSNVIGTANVLDVVRRHSSVCAVIVVTSDKCYENHEWAWGYRENDSLGGHDPYSASKAAAEIVVSSMRRSFFSPYCENGHLAKIASVRAGNVIGGGDWSRDRLIPDIVRGSIDGKVSLRNPNSVRPWQHVLEPLGAYLGLAQKLIANVPPVDTSFNFGPSSDDHKPVSLVAEVIARELGHPAIVSDSTAAPKHEAVMLTLDCSKARHLLGWKPRWNFLQAVQVTADWYKAFSGGANMKDFTEKQIDDFMTDSPYIRR
jgi:CDP-glucose 4,6-dehydratase